MTARVFFSRAILVFLGGTVGTCARVILTLPADDQLEPWLLVGINVLGAGLLGLLIRILGLRADAVADRLRLFFSVGLLGGFTSYSALALHTVNLGITDGGIHHQFIAVGYSAGTLVFGIVATLGGFTLGTRLKRGSSFGRKHPA